MSTDFSIKPAGAPVAAPIVQPKNEAAHRAVVARIRASGKETGRKKNERRVPFPGTRLHSRPSPRHLAAALKA